MGTESAENDQQGLILFIQPHNCIPASSASTGLFESEEMINKYRESGTRDIKNLSGFYFGPADCRRNGACILRRRGTLSETAKLLQGRDLLIAIERLKIINKAKASVN